MVHSIFLNVVHQLDTSMESKGQILFSLRINAASILESLNTKSSPQEAYAQVRFNLRW